jgi:hypothetical protein
LTTSGREIIGPGYSQRNTTASRAIVGPCCSQRDTAAGREVVRQVCPQENAAIGKDVFTSGQRRHRMVQGFGMMRTGHDVPQKTSRVVQWRAKGPAGITHDNVGGKLGQMPRAQPQGQGQLLNGV